MKSLDFFINEPYLMDGGVGGVGAGGGAATATQTTQSDEQKRLAEAARQATENADKATEGVSSDSSAPADAKAMGADTNLPGTKLNTSDPANSTSSSDSTTGNKTEDFAGAQKAPGGLETPLSGGFKMNPATGSISKDGNIIDPKSEAYKGLPDDVKVAVAANTLRLQASQERSSTDKSSTDQAVRNEEAKADAVTQPNGSSDGGKASTGGEKDSTTNANETAKAKEAEAKLNPEQEGILADLNNYNKDTSGVIDPTKAALHVDDKGKPGYCTDLTCGKTNEIKDDKGNITGYSFDKIKSKNGTEHTFKDISTVDLKAANDRYKSDQAAKLAKPEQSSGTSEVPLAKPREDVDLARALELKSEDGKATVIRRGDGVEGDPNHDNAEAKSFLLDGQLDSSKNTFATFDIKGEKYLGFHSEGFGAGDERSGVVKLSEIEGKNLGADGWKPLSSLGAEAKSIGDSLKSAHGARKAEIAKFGGIEGYNQAEKIRENVARLQSHSTTTDKDGKHVVNGAGATAEQIAKLNNIMGRLNNFAEPLSGIQSDLDSLLKEKSTAKEGENKTLADNVLDQRISELSGKGFSTDEINKLKAEGISHSELEKAINDKRDAAHSFDKTDYKTFDGFKKTLNDLGASKFLNEADKQKLSEITKLAGTDSAQADKMGKYLAAELSSLKSKADKGEKDEKAAADAKKKADEAKNKEGKRSDDSAIDFSKDAGKAFKDGLGEDKLKAIFGDNYESNPALKKVVEDYKGLGEAGKEFLDSLKNASKEKTPEAIAKDLDIKLKDAQAKMPKSEAQKELKENISKLEAAQKEKELTKEDSEKLKKNKEEAAAIDKNNKAIEAVAKLSETLKKYSVGEDGKLKRGEDALFAEAPKINEKVNQLLTNLGIPDDQKAKWAKGGTVSFSADDCTFCPKGDDKESLIKQTELDGKPYKMFNFPNKGSLKPDEASLMSLFKAGGFPTSFTIEADGSIKPSTNHWQS